MVLNTIFFVLICQILEVPIKGEGYLGYGPDLTGTAGKYMMNCIGT